MARPLSGSWSSKYFRTKASTQYTKGMLVSSDGTDIIPSATSSTNILGIVDQTKASGDATNDRIKILVPSSKRCTFLATGEALTAAMEGRRFDVVSGSLGFDNAQTTYKVGLLVKCISATSGEFAAMDPIA